MVTQVGRGPWALNAVRDSEELKGGPETRETEDGGSQSAQSREAQGPHPSSFLQKHPGPAQSSEVEQDHTCRQGVCREGGGGQCSVQGAKGDRGWESFLQSRVIAFLGARRKSPEPRVSAN